ncbi:MAG: hypothetical protein AAGB00_02980 [Planctomycetota bacterium]
MTLRALAASAAVLTLLTFAAQAVAESATANAGERSAATPADTDRINLFDAVEQGVVEMKFIAKSDRRARVILANKTSKQVNLQLPEAFAGVPVLGQGFGGGGRGGGGGFGAGGGGGNQAGGGGFGGGGGGIGGGGGQFSIPPEKTSKIDVAMVCLDHGKKDPSSSKPYEMVPANKYVTRPAVLELLKAYGRGELDHAAAQAAVWALNNDMTWAQLAAKQSGTARDFNRAPYFTKAQLQAAMAYAKEANRRAEAAAKPTAQDSYLGEAG